MYPYSGVDTLHGTNVLELKIISIPPWYLDQYTSPNNVVMYLCPHVKPIFVT